MTRPFPQGLLDPNSENNSMYHEMFKDIGLDLFWRDLKIDLSKCNTSDLFKPEEERFGHVIDHIKYAPRKKNSAVDGAL